MAGVICFIGIGSNSGNRQAFCLEALRRLEKLPKTRLVIVSSLYETEPVGEGHSSPFINGVVKLSTELSPRTILTEMFSIEAYLGRDRGSTNLDRPMDLDLLLFGDLVQHEPDLIVPHPRMHERRFVLEPLAEIAPDFVHPVLKEKISDLLKKLSDPHWVRRLL
jgi:2-amino-4-hydroxy-6-hydroxymethyldihydropteridine diphosphokinase